MAVSRSEVYLESSVVANRPAASPTRTITRPLTLTRWMSAEVVKPPTPNQAGVSRGLTLERSVSAHVKVPIAPVPDDLMEYFEEEIPVVDGDGMVLDHQPHLVGSNPRIMRISHFWRVGDDGEMEEYADPIVEPWGRYRIRIADRDVSFHKHVKGHSIATVLLTDTISDPLTYTSAQILFPGFDPKVDVIGEGRWSWLDKHGNARVVIHVVGDGDTDEDDLETIFRGQVAGFNITAAGLGVPVQGRGYPAGSSTVTPRGGYVKRELVEDYCARLFDETPHRRWMRMRKDLPNGPTGIYVSDRGSYESRMAMVTDALGLAFDADGSSYTIRWDEKAGPVFAQRTPRNTWTMHAHQEGLDISGLARDDLNVVHRIYGRGINDEGGSWEGREWPNAGDRNAPTYPSGQRIYYPGDSTPANVGGPFWKRMKALGKKIQSTPTYYHPDDRLDVIALQTKAGIENDPSGSFGPQTWAAAFQPGRGTLLSDSQVFPLAEADWVSKYLRNADGAITGLNPKYDPHKMVIDRAIDFGTDIDKKDGARASRAILKREGDPFWAGTVVVSMDPREGSRFRMRETDKFRLVGLDGETVSFWISQAVRDWTALTVTMAVSERAGHYATLADEIERDNSEKASRRIANGRSVRAVGPTFDAESPAGIIPTTSHYAGRGGVSYVPMPIFGEVVKSEFECDNATEFIVAAFKKPITVAQIEQIIGGNPFEATEDKADDPTTDCHKALKDAGYVMWWGSKSQPLGYGTEQKPDNIDKAAALLDGTYNDEVSWTYRLERDGGEYLYLISWLKNGGHLNGRLYPAPLAY